MTNLKNKRNASILKINTDIAILNNQINWYRNLCDETLRNIDYINNNIQDLKENNYRHLLKQALKNKK